MKQETTHPEKITDLFQHKAFDCCNNLNKVSAHAYFLLKYFMQPEIALQKNKKNLMMLNQNKAVTVVSFHWI